MTTIIGGKLNTALLFLGAFLVIGGVSISASAQSSASASASDPLAELEAWNKIKESSVAADYHAFLKKFPNGSLAAQARARMNTIGDPVWNELKNSKDPFKFRDYIKAHPDSPFIDQAKALFEVLAPALIEWEKLKAAGDGTAVMQFIQDNPSHPFVEEAKADIENSLWAEAVRTGEESLFKFYAEHFSTPRRAQALEKLKEFDDRRKHEVYGEPKERVMANSGAKVPGTYPWLFSYAFESECRVSVTEVIGFKDHTTTDVSRMHLRSVNSIEVSISGDGKLWSVISRTSEMIPLKSTTLYPRSGQNLSSELQRPWVRLGFFADQQTSASFAAEWRKLVQYCKSTAP